MFHTYAKCTNTIQIKSKYLQNMNMAHKMLYHCPPPPPYKYRLFLKCPDEHPVHFLYKLDPSSRNLDTGRFIQPVSNTHVKLIFTKTDIKIKK